MAGALLTSFCSSFEALEIRPELEIAGSEGQSGYAAELRLFLWDVSGDKKNNLADIFEFHIIKRGRQALELDEARSWLERNLSEFVAAFSRNASAPIGTRSDASDSS